MHKYFNIALCEVVKTSSSVNYDIFEEYIFLLAISLYLLQINIASIICFWADVEKLVQISELLHFIELTQYQRPNSMDSLIRHLSKHILLALISFSSFWSMVRVVSQFFKFSIPQIWNFPYAPLPLQLIWMGNLEIVLVRVLRVLLDL